MSRSKPGYIGIDLGSRAIKIAQVAKVGARLQLVRAAVIRRGDATGDIDLAAEGRADWSGVELQAALRQDTDFAGSRAACLLPMHLTELRTFSIPQGTDGERRAMIAAELAATVGGDVEFDYWETDRTGDSAREMEDNVAVLFLSSETTVRMGEEVAAAGLNCEVLDGLPLALGRAVKLAGGGRRSDVVAALDWGYSTATLSVVVGGRPLYTRKLRDGGFGLLVQEVAAGLNLSRDDVQELLIQYGLPGEDQTDRVSAELQHVLRELAAARVSELVDELERTIAFLQIHRPGMVPGRLCLTGGGATIRNIEHELAQRLDRGVYVWRMPALKTGATTELRVPQALLAGATALSALALSA